MIDQFDLINLTIIELTSQLHRNLNTLIDIGLVSQGREISTHVQSQLLRLLIDLSANGIDLHVLTPDLLGIVINGMHHHFDGIGVETTAER